MNGKHTSALGALDAFFDVIRRQAERDKAFSAELLQALATPIEIRIESSGDVAANILHLDPFVIAGKGLDAFREIFGKLPDPDKKKVIKAYNLAAPESLTGSGAPRGALLVTLMWDAASAQRARMETRK